MSLLRHLAIVAVSEILENEALKSIYPHHANIRLLFKYERPFENRQYLLILLIQLLLNLFLKFWLYERKMVIFPF